MPLLKQQIWKLSVDANNITLVDFLYQKTGLSKQIIKQALSKGSIRVGTTNKTRRTRQAKKRLLAGQQVHFYYCPEVLSSTPPAATLIADLVDYSIWNKPYGMYSQGSKWGDHCTLYRWAERHLTPQRPAFPVNRLDRAASGLMILAHNKKTARYFSELFAKHQIEKHYRAWVKGDFKAKDLVIDTPIDGKVALSIVNQVSFDKEKEWSLMDIEIKTGRKHQIRQHLAAAGYAIIGDRLYGKEDSPQQNLQLYSYSLTFICPLSARKSTWALDAVTKKQPDPSQALSTQAQDKHQNVYNDSFLFLKKEL